MTKARIPKQGGHLANHTLEAGWPAPACRAVAAYGRAVAQQVAAGRGVNGRVRSPYRTSGAMQPRLTLWLPTPKMTEAALSQSGPVTPPT